MAKPGFSANIAVFFQSIHHLHLIHQRILANLEHCMDEMCLFKLEEENCQVGDALFRNIPLLSLYSDYVANKDTAVEFVQSDSEIACFLNNREQNILKGTKKFSELIDLPQYRLVKYQAFLRSLRRVTASSHPDYNKLEQAFQIVNSARSDIGTTIKERENGEIIMKLQKQITGLDVNLRNANRMFIKSGSMVKLCRRKAKKYTFFLFSDMLIYCVGSLFSSKLVHKKTIVPTNAQGVPDGTVPGYENAFCVESAKKSFSLIAPSSELKNEWLIALNDMVRE